MAEHGPPPKRSGQRRRVNPPVTGEPIKVPVTGVVVPPEPDSGWHPVALRWFEALKTSGQRVFYEDSDWMTAYAVAESMSREFKPQPLTVGSGEHAQVEMVELAPKAASLAAWLKGAAALLATEGDRRRAAIELERPKAEEGAGDVSELGEYRRRLQSG